MKQRFFPGFDEYFLGLKPAPTIAECEANNKNNKSKQKNR